MTRRSFRSLDRATVNEGGTATYTVSLTDGTDDDATVDFDAAPSGSTSASDYTVSPTRLTVPKGGDATFTVTANTDSVDEPNEPFVVSLSESGARHDRDRLGHDHDQR